MARSRKRKNLFDRVGLTKRDFEVTTLVLGVVVAVSSDAETKLKCDRALKSLKRLRRAVNKRPLRARKGTHV